MASLGEYGLARLLTASGMAPGDVEIVRLSSVPDILTALGGGAIDAANIPQPTAAQAVARGVGRVLIDTTDKTNLQVGVVVANTRFLGQHRDAVSRTPTASATATRTRFAAVTDASMISAVPSG